MITKGSKVTEEQTPLAQCLIALRDAGEATISDLATTTGLSRPTVTAALEELEQRRLVTQDATRVASGRPARTYSFVRGTDLVGALDLTTNPVQFCLADRTGSIVATAVTEVTAPTTAAPELDNVRTLIVATLESAGFALNDLTGIGISVAGLIDDRGVMTSAPQVQSWGGIDIVQHFTDAFGVPVTVDNDLTLAADAECRYGALRGAVTGVLALTWHHVSARITSNGHVIRGRRGLAGEVGLLPAFGETPQKSYDLLGTVPTVAAALRQLQDDPSDPKAIAVRDELVGSMVPALAALLLTMDPEIIVLGGALGEFADELRAPLVSQIGEYLPRLAASSLAIRRGELGVHASLFGALSLAFETFSNALYGIAAVPAPTAPFATEQENNMTTPERDTTPLRIAVVGVGARSGLALHAKPVGGIVTVVVDPAPQTRDRANQLFGDVPMYASATEMLEAGEQVDAAFVTSPDWTHADIAVELLEAGIPAYIEKPMAITIEDADRILEAAYRTKTKVYVGHNMRHMQVVKMMKDIIDRGEIGEVKAIWCRHFVGHGGDYYFKDWHAERAKGTGLLLQKGAHDIDVMHWLAGSASRRVIGIGDLAVYGDVESRRDNSDRRMGDWFSRENWPPLSQTDLNPIIDVEDISMVLMRTQSGVLMSYQQCHFTPDYWRNYTVIGTEGRVENFDDDAGGEVRVWNRRSEFVERGHVRYPITDGGEGGHGGADPLTVAEFIEFVRTGAPTATNPIAAREAVATGVAGTVSIRTENEPQQIPEIPEAMVAYFDAHQPSGAES